MHIKLHDYIFGFIIAHMDLINAYDTKMKYLLSQSPVCCSVWQCQCLSYCGSFSRAAPLPTANTLRRGFSNTRELYSFITINSHINFKESIDIILPDVDFCQVFMSTVEWGQCLCRQSSWLWHSLLQLRLLWCHYHSSFSYSISISIQTANQLWETFFCLTTPDIQWVAATPWAMTMWPTSAGWPLW